MREGGVSFLLRKKNSLDLFNDSEDYSRYVIRHITLWTFFFCSR